MRDSGPVLIKLLQIEVVDDNVEKPAAIQKHIGRRPIASAIGIATHWFRWHEGGPDVEPIYKITAAGW